MVKVELERVNGAFGFEAKDSNGHTVKIDTSIETGGENFGVRPMQLLLMGLGGCSAIDILSILKKQRQNVKNFKLKIEGERTPGVVRPEWIRHYGKISR
jgi:putative redox protein